MTFIIILCTYLCNITFISVANILSANHKLKIPQMGKV